MRQSGNQAKHRISESIIPCWVLQVEVWEAAATLCFLPLLCLASWAASRLDRRNKVSTILYCTILYCTVLYCTVLYCTGGPELQAAGNRG